MTDTNWILRSLLLFGSPFFLWLQEEMEILVNKTAKDLENKLKATKKWVRLFMMRKRAQCPTIELLHRMKNFHWHSIYLSNIIFRSLSLHGYVIDWVSIYHFQDSYFIWDQKHVPRPPVGPSENPWFISWVLDPVLTCTLHFFEKLYEVICGTH